MNFSDKQTNKTQNNNNKETVPTSFEGHILHNSEASLFQESKASLFCCQSLKFLEISPKPLSAIWQEFEPTHSTHRSMLNVLKLDPLIPMFTP